MTGRPSIALDHARGRPRTARPRRAGRAVAVQEQELAAEQADAVRAGLERAAACPRAARCWRAARSRVPSSVAAGVWLQALAAARARVAPGAGAAGTRPARSASGSTITTPASPSTITSSSSRISWLRAGAAPTTAGMFRLRATIAVCEVTPPTSVTKPANVVLLELEHVGGRQVVRDQHQRIDASSIPVVAGLRSARRRASARPCPSAAAARARPPARRRPCARAGTRPRSRRTGARAPPAACVSAHSALQWRSMIQCLAPPVSASS